MKIYIDEHEIEFQQTKENTDENIVQIAKKHGINITAPCFLAKNGFGCCASCLIEIDNKEYYACATKAKDGMRIKYDDPILRAKRHANIKKYKENLKKNKQVFAEHARLANKNLELSIFNKQG